MTIISFMNDGLALVIVDGFPVRITRTIASWVSCPRGSQQPAARHHCSDNKVHIKTVQHICILSS